MALPNIFPMSCFFLVSITFYLAATKPIVPPNSGISSSRSTNATLTSSSLASSNWTYQDYLDQYTSINLRLQRIYSNYSTIVFGMGTKLTEDEKQKLANLLLLSIQIEANFNVTRLSRQENSNIRLLQKLKLWNKQSSLSKAIKTQKANIGRYISKEEASLWKVEYVKKLQNSLSSAPTLKIDSQNPQEGQPSTNPVQAAPSVPLMDCNTSLACMKYQAQINVIRGRIAALKDQAISAIIASMVGMSSPGPLRQTDLVAIKSLSAQANQTGIDLTSKINTMNGDPSAEANVRMFVNQFAQTVACELAGLKITFSQIINPTASPKVKDASSGVASASSSDGDMHPPLTGNQTGQVLSSITNEYAAAPGGGAAFSGNILSGLSGITSFAQNMQQQQQQNPVGIPAGNQPSISLGPSQSQMPTYSSASSFVLPQHFVSSFSDARSPLITKSEMVVAGDVANSYNLATSNTVVPSSSLSSQASILTSLPSSIPAAPVSYRPTPATNASMAAAPQAKPLKQGNPRVSGPIAPPSSRQIGPNGLN